MEAGNEMAGFDGDIIKGQKVKTLVNDLLDADKYEVELDGRDENGKSASDGMYFYRIHSEDFKKINLGAK